MALKNEKGNYLKITHVDMMGEEMNVGYAIYESKAIRDAGLNEFQTVKQGGEMMRCNVKLDFDGLVTDGLKTIGYLALKQSNEFKLWTDC